MKTSKKTHLADTTKIAEDYINSPHVFRAIKEGRFTLCGILSDRISTVISSSICIGCLVEVLHRKCKSTEVADYIVALNDAVKEGLIRSYRFEGNSLFIEPIAPIEYITINAVLDKAIVNGQQDS